jgi:cytidylate kinase
VVIKKCRKIITIDGLAGVGKSYFSKRLADFLNFPLLQSGLMFRLLAFFLLSEPKNASLEEQAERTIVSKKNIFIQAAQGQLNNIDPSSLRTSEVSLLASELATFKVVRENFKLYQRLCFPEQSFIAEGRDMGSEIFPDADLKLFIEAPVTLKASWAQQEISDSIKNFLIRDLGDLNRSIAPTRKTPDMQVFLNVGCKESVFNEIKLWVIERLRLDWSFIIRKL